MRLGIQYLWTKSSRIRCSNIVIPTEKDKVKTEIWCSYFDGGSLQVIDRCEGPQIHNMPFMKAGV